MTDLQSRIIEPSQFVADTKAFIDIRLEKSQGKASYSFIGPGVSQNAEQTINITVPHGFNVGAASMPHGVVNNPHLHYTAEVFICTKGSFRFFIGEHGSQQIDIEAGDVFSAPPWVFRGFENTGPDDGFLFVVLGRDDTGGIVWAPHILEAAAETGLYLGQDYSIIESTGSVPERTVAPMDPAELAVDTYTDAELAKLLIKPDDLAWDSKALLSSVVAGHQSELAPVIGRGLSEHRRQLAPIMNSLGFSLEWLRLGPGQSVGLHRHHEPQVLFLIEGDWNVILGSEQQTPPTGSIVSTPASEWRDFRNVGQTDAVAVVVTRGDSRSIIDWDSSIVDDAAKAGYAIDANGYLASTHMLGRS